MAENNTDESEPISLSAEKMLKRSIELKGSAQSDDNSLQDRHYE